MPTTTTVQVARDWLTPYLNDADAALERIERIVTNAVIDYRTRGVAGADLQPGNGTRYIVALTDLTRLDRPAGRDDHGWYEAVDAAKAFGGDLLVALPEFHRSTVLSSGGFHMPDYVDEKLSLGYPHSCVVAAFLTLFDATLTEALTS